MLVDNRPITGGLALLEAALLRTVLYADVFDYALTPLEAHHYLIGQRAEVGAVRQALETSTWLRERLSLSQGYLTLRGREALAHHRPVRAHSSRPLWAQARRWARVMAALPGVRLVAVTGALAMENAPPGDDIDLLLVTVRGRTWVTRAWAVAVVRAARLAGAALCPNYVLATTALTQAQQDLYTAHDLAQMVPLAGLATYALLRAHNPWVTTYLPQATTPLRQEPDLAPRRLARAVQAIGERLLAGPAGDQLEAWERGRKLRRFQPEAQLAGPEAVLDAERVKGHFHQHGRAILAEYHARVHAHGLAPA